MNGAKVKPGVGWYFLALLVFLAGGVGFVVLLVGAISEMTGGLQRVTVPGAHVLAFEEPGTHQIYHETQTVIDGRASADPQPLNMMVSVSPEGGGDPLSVRQPQVNANYDLGGRSGHVVLQFDVPEPGRYVLQASPAGGRDPARRSVIAVGQMDFAGFGSKILGALAAGAAGFVLSLILFIVTIVKRSKAQSAIRRQQAAPPAMPR